MKKIFWISAVCLFVLFIAGCSDKNADQENESKNNENENNGTEDNEASNASEADGELGDFNVKLSGEMTEEEETFVVNGDSNLLPGSILTGEVIVDDGETIFSETEARVNDDGSFQMDLDHHVYGDAELVIRFDFEDFNGQEEETFEHYGEDGEELEGPFVYRYSSHDKKKAEVTIPYNAKEENNLTIETPEWEEKPDDYGDGRIWFEDVEVEEDGEYFYVSGKSNLVEGAYLKIDYFFTDGEARVEQDGTFESKFDYEYHEEKDMEIEFDPNSNSSQWNHVQKVYGDGGSELVGDLVESSDIGKGNQRIIYPIDWSEDE